MSVKLKPPPLIADYDFSTGKYVTKGIGEFDPDGVHLITWAIGSIDKKTLSGEPKDFKYPPGIEQWVSGQYKPETPQALSATCDTETGVCRPNPRVFGSWGYWFDRAYLADFTSNSTDFAKA